MGAALASINLASSACPPRALECAAESPRGPVIITPDCIDPTYDTPILDEELDLTTPVPHRRVSGHFNSTNIDFNIYLPPKDVWEGRFFQHVYPTQQAAADNRTVAWGAASGGYTIQATGIQGYRAEAALAKFSREVAREYYEDPARDIFGYIYGASGGSIQTVGAVENTIDVWNGAVALVIGVPLGSFNNWPIRSLGGLLLTNSSEVVKDAFSPGGSGDPSPLLTQAERDALAETIALGVPARAWEDFEGVGQNRTQLWDSMTNLVLMFIKSQDPTYADDFWSQEGYLGTEQSDLGEFFRAALVRHLTVIEDIALDGQGLPIRLTLAELPDGINPTGLEFAVQSGNTTVTLAGCLDVATRQLLLSPGNDADVISSLVRGSSVELDNRWFLAVHTYYRHQLPSVDQDFYGFDYMRNADGSPRYPQRESLVAPLFFRSAGGGAIHSGNIRTKLMVMDTLLDYDAFPWQADWYKSRVSEALGSRFDDNFRFYYADNADHFQGGVAPENAHRLVNYMNFYEQHLVELSRWVEAGVRPAENTNYTVEGTQVYLQGTAETRGGVQPLVALTVDGASKTQVPTGQQVTFDLDAAVPGQLGHIIAIETDFYGTGEFVQLPLNSTAGHVTMQLQHVYEAAGTYFAGVRVTSHETGDKEAQFARLMNLGRVRVVVE